MYPNLAAGVQNAISKVEVCRTSWTERSPKQILKQTWTSSPVADAEAFSRATIALNSSIYK